MRLAKLFLTGSLIIVLFWIYVLYVSPRIHKKTELIIPDVSGYEINEGLDELEDLGISYNLHYLEGDDDIIAYTLPKHGMKIYESYQIDVYAYKKMDVLYEDFVGLNYNDYYNEIIDFCNSNNILLSVKYIINNNVSSGLIIEQNKAAGDVVKHGDELTLHIAASDEYYMIPSFVGRNIYDVIAELNANDLSCNIIYHNSAVEPDIVIYQSLYEGYKLKKGSAYSFDLYVSKGFE